MWSQKKDGMSDSSTLSNFCRANTEILSSFSGGYSLDELGKNFMVRILKKKKKLKTSLAENLRDSVLKLAERAVSTLQNL